MIRIVLAIGAIAIGLGAAVAQQEAVTARRDLMKASAKLSYGVVRPMVRDQAPYQQAQVDAAFAEWTNMAEKLPGLFPVESLKGPDEGSNFYANPKIAESRTDFDGHIAKFRQVVADNKGKVTDLASLKAVYATLDESCNSCHQVYRLRKR